MLRQIEEILVSERIISLPERDAGIRIAAAAAAAARPAPAAKRYTPVVWLTISCVTAVVRPLRT